MPRVQCEIYADQYFQSTDEDMCAQRICRDIAPRYEPELNEPELKWSYPELKWSDRSYKRIEPHQKRIEPHQFEDTQLFKDTQIKDTQINSQTLGCAQSICRDIARDKLKEKRWLDENKGWQSIIVFPAEVLRKLAQKIFTNSSWESAPIAIQIVIGFFLAWIPIGWLSSKFRGEGIISGYSKATVWLVGIPVMTIAIGSLSAIPFYWLIIASKLILGVAAVIAVYVATIIATLGVALAAFFHTSAEVVLHNAIKKPAERVSHWIVGKIIS